MLTCYCCRRRGQALCPCVVSTCRVCLYCLTHCACPARGGRSDPAKMAAVDPEVGLDDPSGPFADLADAPAVVVLDPGRCPRAA